MIAEHGERERAIRSLLPLVRRLARRMSRIVPHADYADLVGDGCVGAICAVDAFDPARQVPLRVYAARVIAGKMLNGLRRMDPVPERVRALARRMESERFAAAECIGRMPAATAIAGNDLRRIRARVAVHRMQMLSLDAPLSAGMNEPSDGSRDPAALVPRAMQHEEVRALVASLPPRESSVVRAHYYGEIPLRAIAREMHLSPQRLSQLHAAALQRLRRAMVHRAAR